MKNDQRIYRNYERVVRCLELQKRALVEAGAEEDLVETYSMVVRHLLKLSLQERAALLGYGHSVKRAKGVSKPLPLSEAASLSLEDVERVLNNPDTPRKLLEAVAVARFHFPRGSLRSLSNLAMLRDRIRTMLDGERSHRTIHSVASRIRG